MNTHHETTRRVVEDAIQRDRGQLLLLCSRLVGDRQVAEDLVQETLVTAWQRAETLRDPAAVSAWLTGIARNICRQWLRHEYRQPPCSVRLDVDPAALFADTAELTLDLERAQLATLLRQALSMLPAESRRVLLARIIDESNYRELAAQLGLHESTAMVRLHRAKRQLRQLLIDHYYPEISVYAVLGARPSTTETFGLFCPLCGHGRLIGRFHPASGELVLRCPLCQAGLTETVANAVDPITMGAAKGAVGVEQALTRVMERIYDHYAAAVVSGTTTCLYCGASLRLRRRRAHDPAACEAPVWFRRSSGFYARCHACGRVSAMGLRSLARCSPPGRQFWEHHPRMRTRPARDIIYQGREAALVTLESLTEAEQLDLVFDRATYQLIAHHA